MNVRVQSVGDVILTGEKEILREKPKKKTPRILWPETEFASSR